MAIIDELNSDAALLLTDYGETLTEGDSNTFTGVLTTGFSVDDTTHVSGTRGTTTASLICSGDELVPVKNMQITDADSRVWIVEGAITKKYNIYYAEAVGGNQIKVGKM